MKKNKLFNGTLLTLAISFLAIALSVKPSFVGALAYDGLTTPAITAHFDTSSALVLERGTEQISITVSDMVSYSLESTYFDVGTSGDDGMISEATGNKKYHAMLIPVTFSMHLEAKQQVTFSELDLQVSAYKTTSGGSAACVVELLSDIPETINGNSNNAGSTYSLARCYTSSTTTVRASYSLGEYTFTNNSNEEADVYIPETYYFVTIVRWASGYDHRGVGLVGIGNKYCSDVRGVDDKDIQIEFDDENIVYYRQEGSDESSVSYASMSAVEFDEGENEIFDASINDRLAVVTEKSMNRYFNLILVPFRFYVNLDAYEMVTVSEFEIVLTIRKISSGGTAGAFVELFSARPDTITTTWNAVSSPNYSVGRVNTNASSRELSLIHERIATSCSCDGYSFENDSASSQNIYTSGYYYLAICGNYASTYDHMIEATMNVVPAEGDSVVSYSRDVTFNGTNCTITGGVTANYQSQYNANIVPNAHYTYPTSIEVLMGENTLIRNTHYTYNSANGQIRINANVVVDNITINAIAISVNYTITYSSNGGTGTTTSSSGVYNQTISLRSSSFARRYYSFLEWNTSEEGNGDSYSEGDDYTISGDANLYAIWHQTDSDLVNQFVGIKLHFDEDVISTSDIRDTDACRGESGYYKVAKTAYNALSDDQKELFCTDSNYINARARLNAWATANGETLNTTTYQLQKSSKVIMTTIEINNNNSSTILIVIICLIGLIAICSYAYLRHKKEE